MQNDRLKDIYLSVKYGNPNRISLQKFKKQIKQYALENEKELRKLLWLKHGHTGLYGDDGEMQCSECPLDFKRDSVQNIIKFFDRQAISKMRERIEGERINDKKNS